MDTPTDLYLDHLATSPMLPCAVEAMRPWLTQHFANPASPHGAGLQVRQACENARARVAALLGCRPADVVFTASGTEAINMAIKGIVIATLMRGGPKRVLITPIEHAATRAACDYLARIHAVTIETVAVSAEGLVDLDDLERRLQRPAALCSIVWAHHEIGTLQPIEAIAALTQRAHVPLHIDAVQALAWLQPPLATVPITALSLSGHKFGAGKGIGALVIRSDCAIEPLIHGGQQERRLRGGTHAVANIIAMAEALSYIHAERWPHAAAVAALRDALIARVLAIYPGAQLTGHPSARLPGHASFLFPPIHADAIRQALEFHGLICSSASACGPQNQPSSALLALGMPPHRAESAIRFGLPADLSADMVSVIVQRIAMALADVTTIQPEAVE